MTYCSKDDHLERQIHDLTEIAKERESGMARMKRMAWEASAARAYHQSTCKICQGAKA